MQLTIRDLTNLLRVDESTVSRWIKQRGLPARQIGGQYRINRAELLAWSTANNVNVSLELFDNLEAETDSASTLAESVQAGGIHYQVPGRDKHEVLRALVDILPLPEGADREFLLRLFLAREASAATAIGDGIAIPHVRNPIVQHVDRPTMTIAFLARPVEFGAPDGEPVSVLFTIVCPTPRCHLRLLTRLSNALQDSRFRECITRQAPPEEILQQIHRIERGSAAGETQAVVV